jgi:hypothetical protein
MLSSFPAGEQQEQQSVDGRHKAGHDDQGMGGPVADDLGLAADLRRLPAGSLTIVMAGPVPAIHGFLPSLREAANRG